MSIAEHLADAAVELHNLEESIRIVSRKTVKGLRLSSLLLEGIESLPYVKEDVGRSL